MKIINYLLFISTCILYSLSSFATSEERLINVDLSNGKFSLNPDGLQILFYPAANKEAALITSKNDRFTNPKAVEKNDEYYKISYDDLEVKLTFSHDDVLFEFAPTKDTLVNWPVIGEAPNLKNFLLPEGEGLFIPVKDQKIRKALEGYTLNHMSMLPFVGLTYKDFLLTIIEHTPYRNTLKFNSIRKGIDFTYDFRILDQQPSYRISFTFSEPKLLKPSKIFRSFLQKNNKFVSLKEKIEKNPEIKKLAGAIHIYAWGDGRTINFLEKLNSFGIKKAWIGYEEKPNIISNEKWAKTEYVTPAFIEAGKKIGYLIGSYDSYHTMQPSDKADSYNTDFGFDFYPKGCIRQKDGKILPGFAGIGCAVSMVALEQENDSIISQRIDKFKADGINSYFLDCHAMLEAYDDYSPQHPQTIFDDIRVRLRHMDFLSKEPFVLGSEAAVADAIPFLAFSHGNFATLYNVHYKLTNNKKEYGSWWPPQRPPIFFKPVIANQDYSLRYAPEYRIPLFQAVFHDSIVTTDRWEAPITKFPNLYKQRLLLELLYGVPSIWDLDLKDLEKYQKILTQISHEFADLHSQIMERELTDFEYLSDDRKVQKVIFGNEIIIIANFTNSSYEDIPEQSLKIISNKMNNEKIIKLIDFPNLE